MNWMKKPVKTVLQVPSFQLNQEKLGMPNGNWQGKTKHKTTVHSLKRADTPPPLLFGKRDTKRGRDTQTSCSSKASRQCLAPKIGGFPE